MNIQELPVSTYTNYRIKADTVRNGPMCRAKFRRLVVRHHAIAKLNRMSTLNKLGISTGCLKPKRVTNNAVYRSLVNGERSLDRIVIINNRPHIRSQFSGFLPIFSY